MRHRVLIYPNIWDNPALMEAKPWSKIQAFIWLLTRAAQKKLQYEYNGHTVKLERGQVWTSIRQLNGTLHWGTGKTERFISLLKREGMVERQTEPWGTILTIKNFNKYQGTVLASQPAQRNTPPEHQRNTPGTPPEHPSPEKRNTPAVKSKGEILMEKSLGLLNEIGGRNDEEAVECAIGADSGTLPAVFRGKCRNRRSLE